MPIDLDVFATYIGPTGTYWASGLSESKYRLYRSTDAGVSWQKSGIFLNGVISSFWQSSSGQVIYIGVRDFGSQQGVWVSTNSGANFNKIIDIGASIFSLQEFNGYVYAGGSNIYRLPVSGDGTYEYLPIVNENGYAPLVSSLTRLGNDLIVTSNHTSVQGQGVYKLSPTNVLTTLISNSPYYASATNGTSLLVATFNLSHTASGVQVGTESTIASSSLYAPGVPFNSLVYGGTFVGAGQNGAGGVGDWGLWYSSNGTTWTRSATTSFARSISFGGGVYLAGVTGGVYKSTDGVNWTSCTTSCPPALVVPTVTQSVWGDYNPATNTYPVTLTASPTGGTGTYSYLWSTSSVVYTTELNVIAGQTVSGTVTVTSGSQNQVRNWSVTSPAAPSGYPKRPIILIHGIGGAPGDWIDNGINSYLLGSNYTSNQINIFEYGFLGGLYNYQGDINGIGSRLPSLIDQASSQSLSMGGDGKVDILGFSMGGVVGRQGLVASPSVALKVNKFINIGVPNLGSYIAAFFGSENYLDPNPVGMLGFAKNAILSKVLEIFKGGEQPLSLNSLAAQQLTVGSGFLENLNFQTLPGNVKTYAIHSNEKITLKQKIFFLELNAELELGDLVVDKSSGSTIPGSSALSYRYEEQPQVDVHLLRGAFASEYNFVGDPRGMKYFHNNLLTQPDVRSRILEILNSP